MRRAIILIPPTTISRYTWSRIDRPGEKKNQIENRRSDAHSRLDDAPFALACGRSCVGAKLRTKEGRIKVRVEFPSITETRSPVARSLLILRSSASIRDSSIWSYFKRRVRECYVGEVKTSSRRHCARFRRSCAHVVGYQSVRRFEGKRASK